MEIKILCPVHRVEESIELPVRYANTFEGEIPCGDPDHKRLIKIRLSAGMVMEVARPS